ncbi:MAG: hypothetical protein NVS2B4_04340 [Ramlibacter sp.]
MDKHQGPADAMYPCIQPLAVDCAAGFSGDRTDAAAPLVRTLIACGGHYALIFENLADTPSMSPHLPVPARDIADTALGAADAGVAIVHLHARKPADGRPDQTPGVFREIVGDIKARSNAVINVTTGGTPTMTVDELTQPALQLKPEVASLNMGSMNFGLFPALNRYQDFKCLGT